MLDASLVNLGGNFRGYSMFIIKRTDSVASNMVSDLAGKTEQSISPDTLTSSVQITYGLNPSKIRDGSTLTQHILIYVSTQYSLHQGLRKSPTVGRKAVDSEFLQLHNKNILNP